jgi:hypothetical protein
MYLRSRTFKHLHLSMPRQFVGVHSFSILRLSIYTMLQVSTYFESFELEQFIGNGFCSEQDSTSKGDNITSEFAQQGVTMQNGWVNAHVQRVQEGSRHRNFSQ